MGAMSVSCIKSFKCSRACRCCMIEREEIWDVTNVSRIPLRSSSLCKDLLSSAFANFCKRERGLGITINERNNLDICDTLGIHPLQVAIHEFQLPHPSTTSYMLTPADLLHTFLSGIMKDWIVYVSVITNLISLNLPGKFRKNMSILDGAIASFPRFHPVPYSIARFKQGVSEYVKSALSSQKGMAGGTAGLGGMRFQEFPSMIIQLMLSIGVEGDIIPHDLELKRFGNLLECILVSGFKILDLFFNLNKKKVQKASIPELNIACQGKTISSIL